MQCVAKLQQTAPSTLDTSMKALKWSYHAMGFNLDVKLLRSSRITGMANNCFRAKIHGGLQLPLRCKKSSSCTGLQKTKLCPFQIGWPPSISWVCSTPGRGRQIPRLFMKFCLTNLMQLGSTPSLKCPLCITRQVDFGETWCKVRDLAGLPSISRMARSSRPRRARTNGPIEPWSRGRYQDGCRLFCRGQNISRP